MHPSQQLQISILNYIQEIKDNHIGSLSKHDNFLLIRKMYLFWKRMKKQIAEPSPFVVLSLGPKNFETEEKPNTDSPVWEKPFRFLVHNPHIQKLDIQVLIDKKALGAAEDLFIQNSV